MQIVWFKRDLRVADHAVLTRAALHGPVIPLYIAEPELWQQPDMSGRHWAFISETLNELRNDLAELGQPLVIRCGEAIDVLDTLRRAFAVTVIWSHEETGNLWTFARDKRVGAWCRSNNIL